MMRINSQQLLKEIEIEEIIIMTIIIEEQEVKIEMMIEEEIIGKIKQGDLGQEIETEKVLISRVNINQTLMTIVEIDIVEIEDE